MKIAIFGATGRTGLPLITQALAAGHDIIALVRDDAKLPATLADHPLLRLVHGDVQNPTDVDQTVAGAEAVISVLGRSKNSPPHMQTIATKHIVASMHRYGVRRLVSLTGAGVAAPQDQPKFINHLIVFALKLLSGEVLADAQGHAAVIQQSDLDWVIVRVPRLNDGPQTGHYQVGWVGINTSTQISRRDAASFLLQQATDQRYLHQMPFISN